MRTTVMGNGAWGTAFSVLLHDGGNAVTLWGFDPKLVETLQRTHENADYHPGFPLPEDIVHTNDAAAALAGAEMVVLVIPSQVLRQNLVGWRDLIPADAVIVSLMKGIELGTAQRMTEVILECTGALPDRVVAISGPNLAGELIRRQPAGTTIACVDEETARRVQDAVMGPYFRPYTTTDVVGVELGGAVKNVIALATGMADGLGFGDNAKATVMTRGLAECARLGAALGADPFTFQGLAGLGDLIATCMSPLSRNRTFGEKLGKGSTVEEIVASTRQVAEGVKSCESIFDLACRNGVDMPIVEHVVKVVRGEENPQEMLEAMISRAPKTERAS